MCSFQQEIINIVLVRMLEVNQEQWKGLSKLTIEYLRFSLKLPLRFVLFVNHLILFVHLWCKFDDFVELLHVHSYVD